MTPNDLHELCRQTALDFGQTMFWIGLIAGAVITYAFLLYFQYQDWRMDWLFERFDRALAKRLERKD